MLEFKHVSFLYGKKAILFDINLTLVTSDALIIRGSNGCGKTTLLKLAAGLISPYKGKIIFKDNYIEDDLSYYQKNILYIGHKLGVHSLLTPYEHWKFELGIKKFQEIQSIFIKYMHDCGLQDVLHNACCTLSAGQFKKVALFKLWIAQEKSVWILDEPFAMLDKKYIVFLQEHINSYLKKSGSVIFSSHENFDCNYNYKEFLL